MERSFSRLCSSPMSMKMSSKIPAQEFFASGDGETTLEHVLEQADGFETDGLAAGVGAGDEEQASAIAEGDVEGNHLLAVALEALLEEGVTGFDPVDARFGLQTGGRRR